MTNDVPPGQISCPICLSRITWGNLPKWRFDPSQNDYVQLVIPQNASPEQTTRMERDAAVRCPDPAGMMDTHYLPADYGSYGRPVLIGFIGETRSGKSHLLAAMVGEIERGALSTHGIRRSPIDSALHHRFLDEHVWPLLDENRVLENTPEGIISFVDAYLMTPKNGPQRPVALFDVSGNDLIDVRAPKSFLDIVDGLVFVVDAAQLHGQERGSSGSGDRAFKAVIDVVRDRLPEIRVAVVLNKADLVRFDDPITKWWLRPESEPLDAELMLSESADVYAYLQSQGAKAWISDFDHCTKVTLHVVSATGGRHDQDTGKTYPRGVTPRRVVMPLVSLLAMTGVLQGPQAQRVGI
jgi:hypothetical protein